MNENPWELITDSWVSVQDLKDKLDELLDGDEDEDAARLATFLSEAGGCDEVIYEGYVGEYFDALIDECLPADFPSFICIDWENTHKNLLMDYVGVEFEGSTFYVR